MRLERCTNPDCRRPFQVNEFDFVGKTARQVNGYICPHCGHSQIDGKNASCNSTVLIHALSEEQEAEFNRTHPLQKTAGDAVSRQ